MFELRYFIDAQGRSRFADWFSDLDAVAAAKVAVCLARIEQGNMSNVKGVGEGVLEYRVDWGPGYRVYFGQDHGALVILLICGTKKRQQNDIAQAKTMWAEYKKNKTGFRA